MLCSKSGGDDIVKGYRRLKEYADANGFKIIGNGYEEDMLSYVVDHNGEDYLVRCMIQVEIPPEMTS